MSARSSRITTPVNSLLTHINSNNNHGLTNNNNNNNQNQPSLSTPSNNDSQTNNALNSLTNLNNTSNNNSQLSLERQREEERRVRRQIANSNERRRMQSINNGFMSLRTIIPDGHDEKLSKAAVLQQTASYVRQLEKDKLELMAEIDRLKGLIENKDSSQLPVLDSGSIEEKPKAGNEVPNNENSCNTLVEHQTSNLNENSTISPNVPVSTEVDIGIMSNEQLRKEILAVRIQLERERDLRLKHESKIKELETLLYPTRLKQATADAKTKIRAELLKQDQLKKEQQQQSQQSSQQTYDSSDVLSSLGKLGQISQSIKSLQAVQTNPLTTSLQNNSDNISNNKRKRLFNNNSPITNATNMSNFVNNKTIVINGSNNEIQQDLTYSVQNQDGQIILVPHRAGANGQNDGGPSGSNNNQNNNQNNLLKQQLGNLVNSVSDSATNTNNNNNNNNNNATVIMQTPDGQQIISLVPNGILNNSNNGNQNQNFLGNANKLLNTLGNLQNNNNNCNIIRASQAQNESQNQFILVQQPNGNPALIPAGIGKDLGGTVGNENLGAGQINLRVFLSV